MTVDWTLVEKDEATRSFKDQEKPRIFIEVRDARHPEETIIAEEQDKRDTPEKKFSISFTASNLLEDEDYTISAFGVWGSRTWQRVLLCRATITTPNTVEFSVGPLSKRSFRNLVANPGFEDSSEHFRFFATGITASKGLARHWTPFYTGRYNRACGMAVIDDQSDRYVYPYRGNCCLQLGLEPQQNFFSPQKESYYYGAHQAIGIPPHLEKHLFMIHGLYFVYNMTGNDGETFSAQFSWQMADGTTVEGAILPLKTEIVEEWVPFCATLQESTEGLRMLHIFFHLHQRQGQAFIDDVAVVPLEPKDRQHFDCYTLSRKKPTVPQKPHEIARHLVSTVRPRRNQLTLSIPLTSDRVMRLVAVTRAYEGPICAVVLVRDESDILQFSSIWSRQKYLRTYVDIQFLVDRKSLETGKLPINAMRNAALRLAITDYVLMLDVDLMPGTDSFACFRDPNSTYLDRLLPPGRREALVVPVFLTDTIFRPPRSKSELLNALHHRTSLPYCLTSQRGTRFDRWYGAQNTLETKFETDYEPYCIVRRDLYPAYDERFVGYGFNKVSWTVTATASGFRFLILSEPFLIHLNHIENTWVQDISPTDYLQTWRRYFAFTGEVNFQGHIRPYKAETILP